MCDRFVSSKNICDRYFPLRIRRSLYFLACPQAIALGVRYRLQKSPNVRRSEKIQARKVLKIYKRGKFWKGAIALFLA
ncbi:MAG: hypothetical protein KME54_11810 [Tolypothrix brevis GSE-NOS-MK-07-07A]|nr:hypothetical protein [Tolypothrix brevis GSE-NOS-MK-07-07A]